MSSMNFWPPKPGSTVMTRAMSIWLAQGASSSTVVAGFMATPTCRTHTGTPRSPTFMPLSWISLMRFPGLVVDSMWKVYWLAPAAAMAFTHCSGRDTIMVHFHGVSSSVTCVGTSVSPKKGSGPTDFLRHSTMGCPKSIIRTHSLPRQDRSLLRMDGPIFALYAMLLLLLLSAPRPRAFHILDATRVQSSSFCPEPSPSSLSDLWQNHQQYSIICRFHHHSLSTSSDQQLNSGQPLDV
ncbi:hypothetical protein EYF80_050270 [Liparis tanakae]|uniref:Uncharacterized protein n=1 Tax=Liparis tanakae TaxID=230148 RepID=A0A4Z2FEJ8_9TELE|nr:hypothetical protein EYF80_050270 [Liparis tanakae]